jgi:hypothetical protein
MSSDLWLRQREGQVFIRRLFNHSTVLAERAAIMECKEDLLWVTDVKIRTEILDRMERLTAAIDDRLSETIVKKRKNREGNAGVAAGRRIGGVRRRAMPGGQ